MAYAQDMAQKSRQNHEMDGLIRVLNSAYNPARLAGDIYRNPEVLPTGGNLYQFDPRLIPTVIAMERGRRICDNTLALYHGETGAYPQSVAVILWGLETSRTQGETFAQILAYLGVRMSKQSGPWETRYEIIPLAELGRPRIDVTINICGFFRDMFFNLIETLDDLFHRLYRLEEGEEENFFRAHSRRLYADLCRRGMPEEEAQALALSRIFGPREGEYGTGITGLIEAKAWEKEEEIGTLFTSSLRHVYNRQMRGRHAEGLYEENLKCVDIVSQLR
ncbi:MAG TPA: cobaltochelatase subunit CobN, partial [Clostridia bacterium]|nr:cobaltochelatase subunit CobN [Clostridia bacterium]